MRVLPLRRAKWMGLGALIISGCAGPTPPPAPAPALEPVPVQNAPAAPAAAPATPASTAGGTDADSSFDNLDIVDSSLTGKVAVLRVGSELGENNLLSVFAGLKNKTTHRLNLEMQTIYKDKDDNALNAGSWIPMTLKPHEEREYRSASISEQAVDFLIRIRRAPNAATTHE